MNDAPPHDHQEMASGRSRTRGPEGSSSSTSNELRRGAPSPPRRPLGQKVLPRIFHPQILDGPNFRTTVVSIAKFCKADKIIETTPNHRPPRTSAGFREPLIFWRLSNVHIFGRFSNVQKEVKDTRGGAERSARKARAAFAAVLVKLTRCPWVARTERGQEF